MVEERRPAALAAALASHWAEHQERAKNTQCFRTQPELDHQHEQCCRHDAAGTTDIGHDDGDSSASVEGSEVCDFLDDLDLGIGASSDDSGEDSGLGSDPSPSAAPQTTAARCAAVMGADTIVHLAGLLKKTIGRCPHVLDIGCGDGALLLRLHESTGVPWSHLVGITADEPIPGQWDLRTHHPEGAACVHVADFERCPGACSLHDTDQAVDINFDWLRRFDLVFSLNTFHHLLDPIGAVQSALGLLSPGILKFARTAHANVIDC